MVSGGPPCQPFSMGGKAQAYNDKRDMFPEAVRAVREIMPEVFIFENVKGLLRKSFSLYFSYIILQLTYPSIQKPAGMTWEEHRELLEKHHTSSSHDDCEYNVVFRLLNAADYGVPQLRHRVVIVGFRKDIDAKWSFPKATHSKEALLYSKWITGDYWEQHKLLKPSESPLSKTWSGLFAQLLNVPIKSCFLGKPSEMRYMIYPTLEATMRKNLIITSSVQELKAIPVTLARC